jgi:hypothetical protein
MNEGQDYEEERWEDELKFLCPSEPLLDLTQVLEVPRMKLTSLGAGMFCSNSVYHIALCVAFLVHHYR